MQHKQFANTVYACQRMKQVLVSVGSAVKHRLMSLGVNLDLTMGSATSDDLAFLRDLVERSQQFPGPIVEIGTLAGRTTIEIALAKGPAQKCITVDSFEWNPWRLAPRHHQELAAHSLRFLVETDQVEQIISDKAEFYRTYSGPPPALVFLDAIHTYEETKKDLEWARSVGAALIAGHDYCGDWPGVIQAVDEVGGPSEVRGSVFLLAQS